GNAPPHRPRTQERREPIRNTAQPPRARPLPPPAPVLQAEAHGHERRLSAAPFGATQRKHPYPLLQNPQTPPPPPPRRQANPRARGGPLHDPPRRLRPPPRPVDDHDWDTDRQRRPTALRRGDREGACGGARRARVAGRARRTRRLNHLRND